VGVSADPLVFASAALPEERVSPALPEDGPGLLLASTEDEPHVGAAGDPSPDLLRLATLAHSLLTDSLVSDNGDPFGAGGAAPLAPVALRRRVSAVADLLRDAAEAGAAADAHVAAARAEAGRITVRAEADMARLWRTVSADVATRRAATDAFVARALERAEHEADAVVADASARADLLLARAEDLVAAWLDEANAEVARVLDSAPAPAAVTPPALAPVVVPDRSRRRLRRLFRRLFRRRPEAS
jgi:vacuolar-type H+-ATPase subunit H